MATKAPPGLIEKMIDLEKHKAMLQEAEERHAMAMSEKKKVPIFSKKQSVGAKTSFRHSL